MKYIPNLIDGRQLINAYSNWLQVYTEDNSRKSYLVTFMFKPMKGNPRIIIQGMGDEVDKVYSTFLTRAVRKPNCPSQKEIGHY